MRCARVQDRLLLYLAGELSTRERASVMRHLETCANCSALAEALAETQEHVDAGLSLDAGAPAALDARVMDAVRALPAPGRRQLGPSSSGHFMLRRLGWGLAAGALAVLGYGAGIWAAG